MGVERKFVKSGLDRAQIAEYFSKQTGTRGLRRDEYQTGPQWGPRSQYSPKNPNDHRKGRQDHTQTDP